MASRGLWTGRSSGQLMLRDQSQTPPPAAQVCAWASRGSHHGLVVVMAAQGLPLFGDLGTSVRLLFTPLLNGCHAEQRRVQDPLGFMQDANSHLHVYGTGMRGFPPFSLLLASLLQQVLCYRVLFLRMLYIKKQWKCHCTQKMFACAVRRC